MGERERPYASVEFEHGALRYRAYGSLALKVTSIECEVDEAWKGVEDPPLPLKMLATESLRMIVDVATDRMGVAERILEEVRAFVVSGGASEPCEAALLAILSGRK